MLSASMKNPGATRRLKSVPSTSNVRYVAIGLGLALGLVNALWVIKAEIVRASIHATVLTIFFNVTFTMFLLTGCNLAARRFLPRASLRQPELLTIYAMLASTTGLYGIDLLTLLIPTLGHATWFATPENEWRTLFSPYLPRWLTVSDRAALRGYYEGGTTFWTARHVRAWATPLFAWSLFTFVLMFMALCLNVIVRRQWVEEEKLSYPIIQLPWEMTDARGTFFANRLMWVGFGLSGAYSLLRSLHYWFPALPAPAIEFDLAPLFRQKPWNAVRWLPIRVYPFVVGMAYFMPLDLSLSFWFFYLMWKAQLVFRAAVGWGAMPGVYLSGQISGAWLGIGLLALWNTRRQIRSVVTAAFASDPDDSREPMRYRTAVFGFFGSLLFLVLFWHQTGMTLWAALAYFVLYQVIVLAATRMRAELGPPAHELHGAEPDRIMIDTFGKRPFGAPDLVGMSLLHWTSYAHRGAPMGHQLEAFKLADRARIDPKRLNLAILLATALTIPATGLILLTLFYHYGGTARVLGYSMGPAREMFDRLQHLLTSPVPPDASVTRQRLFGLLLTAFLMTMKRRFLWWPFHPVGYAVAAGWTVSWMWFSVFLSWGMKSLVLRLGGLRTFRRSVPLFLGLILGQFIVGSAWTIVSVLFDVPIYRFFP